MDRAQPKVFKVKNPLKKALYGAMTSREEALSRAAQHLENLRSDYVGDLVKKVARIEELAGPGPRISEEALNELSVLAPVIFNLAGTFGYVFLQQIAASLYDTLVITAGMDLNCRALVLIHARAAKLAAPGMPEIAKGVSEQLLSELRSATLAVSNQARTCRNDCSVCPM